METIKRNWQAEVKGKADSFFLRYLIRDTDLHTNETAIECVLRFVAVNCFRRVRGIRRRFVLRHVDFETQTCEFDCTVSDEAQTIEFHVSLRQRFLYRVRG